MNKLSIVSPLLRKVQLLKGLATGDFAYSNPLFVSIDITLRCNLHCQGCLFHSTDSPSSNIGEDTTLDIPLEQAEAIFAELKSMGTTHITLTGEGEPLLHPQIIDIIRAAKSHGLHTTLITNVVLLDRKKIEGIIDLKLDVIRVSLWASSKEIYRKVYPDDPPKMFGKMVNEIKTMTSLKAEKGSALPIVILHNIITKYNFDKLDELAYLANSLGCDAITFGPLKIHKSMQTAIEQLTPPDDKLDYLLSSLKGLKKLLKSYSLENNIDEILLRYDAEVKKLTAKSPCYIGWLHAHIRVDGNVAPCVSCDTLTGNIDKGGLAGLWNNDKYRAFRSKMLSNESAKKMTDNCDCGYCCHLHNNLRVHKIFRWIKPFTRG